MKTIDVSGGYSPFREFSTINEAIAATEGGDLFMDECIRGVMVDDVTWSESIVAIRLVDGRSLEIGIRGRETSCVLKAAGVTEPLKEQALVRLRFHKASSSDVLSQIWDRGFLRAAVGRRLLNVFSNPPNIFIYIESYTPIMFRVLWNIKDKHPILYWAFAE